MVGDFGIDVLCVYIIQVGVDCVDGNVMLDSSYYYLLYVGVFCEVFQIFKYNGMMCYYKVVVFGYGFFNNGFCRIEVGEYICIFLSGIFDNQIGVIVVFLIYGGSY